MTKNIKCYVILGTHILDGKMKYGMFWLKMKEASILHRNRVSNKRNSVELNTVMYINALMHRDTLDLVEIAQEYISMTF